MIKLNADVVSASLGPVRQVGGYERQVGDPENLVSTPPTPSRNGLLTYRVDLSAVGAPATDCVLEMSLADANTFKAGDKIVVAILTPDEAAKLG